MARLPDRGACNLHRVLQFLRRPKGHLLGIASNIDLIEDLSAKKAKARYEAMRADESVSEASLAEGLWVPLLNGT
jgi:hypothetical protein